MKRAVKHKAKSAGNGGRTLADQVVDAPRLSAPKDAKARVGAWLAEIGRTEPGKALKKTAASPKVEALLTGLADGSPFLWDLASGNSARPSSLFLDADPDAHFASLIAETARAVAATKDEDKAMRLLRLMKSEAALVDRARRHRRRLAGDADHARSHRACRRCGLVINRVSAARRSEARARTSWRDVANPGKDSGFIVLAMGKMGAFELNYSSDVDLIVFYEPQAGVFVRRREKRSAR